MMEILTIEEAIAFCHEKSNNIKLKAEPQVFIQLGELLEELKARREAERISDSKPFDVLLVQRYNKAIDDFVEKLKMEYERYDIDDVFESSNLYSYTSACYIFENYIEKIAEQLKAGGDE